MKNILDLDNSFYTFAKKLLWVFVLNILFILTAWPIVTIGASAVAMNSVMMKIINERDFSVIEDYFKAFKDNFVKSTVIWVPSLFVMFLLYVDIFYWVKYGIEDGIYGYIMLVLSCVISALFLVYLHTVFPLISRFELSFKEILSYSFNITLENIGYCIEATVLQVAVIGFTGYMILSGSFLIMFYMIFVCFGLDGLIQAYIYRRVLNKYSEEYVEMVRKVQEEMRMEQGDEVN